MEIKVEEIRSFVQERIRQVAVSRQRPVPEMSDALNLIETGLFDSLGFVQLISAIETEFHIELDTGDLGPEEFTLLGNLVSAAAQSSTAAN